MTSPDKVHDTRLSRESVGEEVLTDTDDTYLVEIDDGFIHTVHDDVTITLGGWDEKYEVK